MCVWKKGERKEWEKMKRRDIQKKTGWMVRRKLRENGRVGKGNNSNYAQSGAARHARKATTEHKSTYVATINHPAIYLAAVEL
jgi:hypothetical protein